MWVKVVDGYTPCGYVVCMEVKASETNQPTKPMNINCKTKDIKKAAKEAGITFGKGKGSHEKWTDKNGKSFSYPIHGKECKAPIAIKAWAFIAGDYAKAGIKIF
jgi:predicted RNA binding protein YcfA (HicA-like mRNA interferase family)